MTVNREVLGYADFILTGHAQDQMKIRGITVDDIVHTLNHPTKTGLPTQPGRQRYRWHKTVCVAIDVVWKVLDSSLTVITVIKPERRLVERQR